MTRITINDSNITENGEMPVIEVRRYVLIQLSSERLVEHRGFEIYDVFD